MASERTTTPAPSSAAAGSVSVVIPLYGYLGIDEVVRALLDGPLPAAEVLVVDNTEDEARRGAIAQKLRAIADPRVRHLPQERNLGVTGGRNKGFEAVSPDSEFVLFLDHDVIPAPDALANLVRDFREIESRGRIGVLTGKVVFKDDHGLVWAAGTDISLWHGKILFHGGRDEGQFEEVRRVGVAPSILFSRVALVRELGGFDDTFFANYDDTEFSFRYASRGYPTWYTPRAVGYHDIPSKGGDPNRLLDRGYYIARNRILFMRRYAKCYPLFLCFIPLWCLYYAKEYARNGRLRDFWRLYVRGTIDGLFHRMRSHT